MYRKTNPKNKNITVRVSQRQYRELNEIAHSHDLSVSEWANYILSHHKNDYRKRENLEKLKHDVDLANLKTELIDRVLEKLNIDYKTTSNRTMLPQTTQLKLAIKILEMTTYKSGEAIDELIRDYHF